MSLTPASPDADIGVLVGRFQVHRLHQGHIELLEGVQEAHQKVIVFLGVKPGVLVTRKNPLDFQSRKAMIQAAFPRVTVLPISDQPSDKLWSKDLDRRILEITEGCSVVLYGSRDSFIPCYSGKHLTVELAPAHKLTGSSVRKGVSHEVRNSSDFRQGVIYAAHNKHANVYQTVDMAVVREDEVLLVRKHSDDGQWRFPGGFVSTSDKSLERAAARELYEETGGLGVDPQAVYLGSTLIDDWRYADEQEAIMTSFFQFNYMFGEAKGSDDVDEAEWFTMAKLTEPGFVVDSHVPLVDLLISHLQRAETQ